MGDCSMGTIGEEAQGLSKSQATVDYHKMSAKPGVLPPLFEE